MYQEKFTMNWNSYLDHLNEMLHEMMNTKVIKIHRLDQKLSSGMLTFTCLQKWCCHLTSMMPSTYFCLPHFSCSPHWVFARHNNFLYTSILTHDLMYEKRPTFMPSTIVPFDHHSRQTSCLSAIWSFFMTFKPFGWVVSFDLVFLL